MMELKSRLNDWLGRWLGKSARLVRKSGPARGLARGPADIIVVLDGTMSTIQSGMETNAGLTYRLLAEVSPSVRLSVLYEPGIQWDGLRHAYQVIVGIGINRQIQRAYGFIASHYRPGDRIFLFGFSRGAFAVRSLAGVIDRLGLLKAEHATERNIRQIYRHYRYNAESRAANVFSRRYCHKDTPVQMVGVWDTVKALGLRMPIVWRWSLPHHDFHNHRLGRSVLHGYHALALDETRLAFEPVIWSCPQDHPGEVQQVWFRGSHGDVGGHVLDVDSARPLANIPLVWMLDRAVDCGLTLPEGWRDRFPQDAGAPSVGTFRGWGKIFFIRRRREVGRDPSEAIHPSAAPYPGLRQADVAPRPPVAEGPDAAPDAAPSFGERLGAIVSFNRSATR